MAQATPLLRPALYSLAVITIAGGVLYSVYRDQPTSALRRSNAVHRPRRERHEVGIEPRPATPDAPLGMIILRKGDDEHVINLATTTFPSPEELQQLYPAQFYAQLRNKIGVAAIELILFTCLKASNGVEYYELISSLGLADLVRAMTAGDQNQFIREAHRIPEIRHMDGITSQQVDQAVSNFMDTGGDLSVGLDAENEPDLPETEDMDATDATSKEPSHGLRGLLYYIAEEDAKRKAYEHRGIRCEECGDFPIRGIRYHCLNCPDYDLCASCEQHSDHVKTHVFAKIRIPLPVLSQPTKEYRLWYPGDPRKQHESLDSTLRKQLCQDHGYEEPDIDALYDQFLANANVPFPSASSSVKAAIDRRAFNRALTRETWNRCFSANAMYDRMFAFYDADMNGIIDFEEFVAGVAYLRGPKRFATLERAIRGYDMDGNGFVDRADFIRLLRAKYEIQQQLVSDMVEGQEIETTLAATEVLQSSQPISSVFSQEDIPPGESRPRRGKVLNSAGDMEPTEGTKTILDDDDPWHRNNFSRPATTRSNISRFEEMLYGSFDGSASEPHSMNDMEQVDGLPQRTSEDPMPSLNGESRVVRLDPDALTETVEPHIPDIIWQVVENGLNELLDKIFKVREQEDEAVQSTLASRQKWAKQIAAVKEEEQRVREELVESAKLDPLVEIALNRGLDAKEKPLRQQNGAPRLQRQMVPTDQETLERREREIADAPLEELLDRSGFGVRHRGSATVISPPRAAHIGASSIWDGSSRSAATSPLRTVTSSDEEESVDPTLPQNRPNSDADATKASSNHNKKHTPPALPERQPSKEHLRYLAGLDDAEQQLNERGGPGRLSYTETESMAVADQTGELRGLIKNWLEYASF